MPTYEYRCPDGHDFEKFYRKISDASSEVDCPTCGKRAERRMSVGAGLLFKGSGFYLTDYGRSGSKGKSDVADGGGPSKPVAKEGGAKDGGAKDGGARESGSAAKESSAAPAKKESVAAPSSSSPTSSTPKKSE